MPKVGAHQQPAGKSPGAIAKRKGRRAFFNDADGRCFYCGGLIFEIGCHHKRDWLMPDADGARMVPEHVTPRSRGGSDDLSNLVAACYSCNIAKGSLMLEEYRFVVGLRAKNLSLTFPGEGPPKMRRDWLCVHSPQREKELFFHNFPKARIARFLSYPAARGM